jgi:LPXTG-motif cell wall-anchored protein
VRIRVIVTTATTAASTVVACIALLLLSASSASAGGYGGGTFTIDDPTLGRGQEFHLSGTGCLPGATVAVTFDGRQIGAPSADGDGSFELVGIVPQAAAPGRFTVTATCGDLVQSLEVTVSAEAVATPASMPRTGTEIGPLLRTAAAMVLVGIGLVLLARRRRATVRPA